MKDIEIIRVVRDDLGEVVKKVEVIADYHMDFSFIVRNGKIFQVSGGKIRCGIYARMMRQVSAIFNLSVSPTTKKDKQLKITF